MSINLDVVCIDPQTNVLHSKEGTVQVIGELLPFVLRKYGIDCSDCFLEITEEFPQSFEYSI